MLGSRASGVAQLSLVEHALCQLDTRQSLRPQQRFETGFFYSDAERNRRFADVSVGAAFGFSPADEYYLWGLLALTFNQPQPSRVFHATPYFCLRKLGFGDSGKHYAEFRGALDRIAGLSYLCSAFYDPVRRERRRVGFQFLSYSLPLSDDSSRAWEFTWNDTFFEHCAAAGGKLFFDLTSDAYRRLDPASRRLFLLLHKVFWRRAESPRYDVRHLAVQVLGFSAERPMFKLKYDVTRCIERLVASELITMPPGILSPAGLFQKRSAGQYSLRFFRGPYFEKDHLARAAHASPAKLSDLPLYDPLKAIGFEDRMIRWIVRKFKPGRVQMWTDITLAKLEREGRGSFSASPQAFFIDNLKTERTKPDWYLELKKEEVEARRQRARDEAFARLDMTEVEDGYRAARATAWRRHLDSRGVTREEYLRVAQALAAAHEPHLGARAAAERATQEAERRFATGFEFPDLRSWAFQNHMPTDGTGASTEE